MKKALTLIFSLFVSVTVMAQVTVFRAALTPINNSSVSGYLTGFYDQKTSMATLAGTATSFAASVTTNLPPKQLTIKSAPTTGIIYNLDEMLLAKINIKKIFTSTSTALVDVHSLKLYTFFQNEYYSMESIFKANPKKEYTLLLNAGSTPVAYASFAVIPEPVTFLAVSGLGLIGFGIFQTRLKNKW